jgi:hypothetical protein
MKLKKTGLALCLATAMLTACGGGSDPLTLLLDPAATQQSEARRLAVDAPCTEDGQCGALTFDSTNDTCPKPPTETYFKIYSLASETAAQAKAAIDEYNRLAAEARALRAQSTPPYTCILLLHAPPRPVCQAGKCIADPPLMQ